ncbi:MAG: amidohydrolase family protein [Chloroflexi bacterium]|nr:amidohydrolase family protein [Chloroflexota bacterium]
MFLCHRPYFCPSAVLLDDGFPGYQFAAAAPPGDLDDIGAGETIDATGMIVLPGGIEPHAHINVPVPDYWAGGDTGIYTQPPEAASRAAAFGGVTTYVDFAGALPLTPGAVPPSDPIMGQIEVRRDIFRGHSFIDYTFHYILAGAIPPVTLGEIGEAIQSGVASFKIFTTFHARVPMGHLWEIFQEVGKNGGIMAVHAEEDEIVTYMEDKLERMGCDHGSNLHLAHNNISEDVSFRKVTRLAESTETGIYFVHTTAKEGVNAIAEARAKQLPVYGEALHNYLEFTCDDYLKPDGLAIHTYPAIKFSDDREALQQGLVDGPICTTATDEWTTYKNVKLAGDTIRTLCGGHNGIETRMPVTYTKLVAPGRIGLERFAAITSTNAAKILGMYPQKGAIAVGSDADIVIFDPNLKKTITVDELHAESDYSIWDGFECEGYPIMTMLRGKVIVRDGQLLGDSGDGRWLSRRVAPGVVTQTSV